MSRYTPLKNFDVAPPPPPVPGGVAPKFGSEKVSRYTGVSQLQLRVSRYTVQLRSVRRKRGEANGDRSLLPALVTFLVTFSLFSCASSLCDRVIWGDPTKTGPKMSEIFRSIFGKSFFLSSAGVGKSRVLPMRVPNPSPTLD